MLRGIRKQTTHRREFTAQEQYALGQRYEQGLTIASIENDPIQVDLVTAAYYYRESARQGCVPAIFKYGIFCMYGKGDVPRNLEHARVLITKAVDAGHNPAIEALNVLGALFCQDSGNVQHVQFAKVCFEKVFNSGLARAGHNLAMWHIHHSPYANKHIVAANYLWHAMTAGCFHSCLILGKIFEQELIPEPREGYLAKAHAMFSLALAHNVPYAAGNLERVNKIFQNQRELLESGVNWNAAENGIVRFSGASAEEPSTENGTMQHYSPRSVRQ